MTLVDCIPWFDTHWSQLFTEFDLFIMFTSRLIYTPTFSRYGDFCANDNNDDMITSSYPLRIREG